MDDDGVNIAIRIGAWDDALQAYPVEASLDDGGSFGGGRLVLDRAALRATWLDPVGYGRLLTDALLAGPIRKAYDLAAAQADAQANGRLRVQLRIDGAAAELHALQWERLRHRHRGRDVPLATSTVTTFSRYVGLEAAEVAPLAARPVHLLVAVANPSGLPADLAPIDVAREVQLLTEALGGLRHNPHLAVTILPGRSGLPPDLRERIDGLGYHVADGPTSLDNLRRLLLSHHALHFVGHGSFRRSAGAEPGVALVHLEAEDGSWEAVADDRFVLALAAAGVLPHLVFLVACESAVRDEASVLPFVGLGPKLVEAGVPAVVAMQDKVLVRAARQLAGDFWRGLLAHGEVDRALNAARLLLVDDEGTDWSTPVLFMRLTNGRLFVPHPPARPHAGQRPSTDAAATEPADRVTASTPHVESAGGLARVSGIRATWSALPGIAKSVIGLLTLLVPLVTALVQAGLLPLGSTPPAKLSAEFEEVRLGEPNVTLGEVYRDYPESDPADYGFSPDELDTPGQLVSYRIAFEGLLGRRCVVEWTLFDAATGERVPDGAWATNRQLAFPVWGWDVEAVERDVGQGVAWIPHVAPGRFVIEFEVYEDLDKDGDGDVLLGRQRAEDAEGKVAVFIVS